ncbi:S-protein homolog 18-like [Hibiscus syriacus]|uniref:S-protein homolog 18-like n=1 Tax=Hibiscus syriacus TaxID=106335 RepID=UPI00192180C2|nr:S-protein homolog 18-like [Hibiscus syriacus]
MADLKKIAFPMLAFSVLYPWVIAVSEDLWFINYHIHIVNDAPNDLPPGIPSLRLHCMSGDRDIGERWMLQHEDYTWDTKINLIRTTLFHCNIWWEGKKLFFDAFKATRDERRCRKYHNSCMWSVREDGVYFSNDNSTWFNSYPWKIQ